jgi:hypothetical protein
MTWLFLGGLVGLAGAVVALYRSMDRRAFVAHLSSMTP